jgi:uncharacterized protein YoxC
MPGIMYVPLIISLISAVVFFVFVVIILKIVDRESDEEQ